MVELLQRRRLLQPACAQATPALFLDRDGVLIEHMHHLCDPGQVMLCPGSQALLKAADRHGWAVVVITNQSGIARGYFDWAAYERVTDELLRLLGAAAPLAGKYANGHGPDAPAESWREPSPAALLVAERELNLGLKRSILEGGRRSDLEAGARAVVPTLVHVLTGHGDEEQPGITAWAQQEQEARGQNPKTELWFLDSLLAFPPRVTQPELMSSHSSDVLILGGGMVGLSIAHQLLERGITSSITILDKEPELGRHSSGRNSGVLHAGLYYTPGSLRAKVYVEGARRLRRWVEERGLPLNPCGKVIVPPRAELDAQLDVLAERGRANGAKVEFWDADQLHDLIPEARTASGRALWSPNTAVVKPISVVRRLREELAQRGVNVLYSQNHFKARPEKQQLMLSDGTCLGYGHLFNCTGLQGDRVAHLFGVGEHYSLLPFKGLYWQLKANCLFQPRANLYPVPDLNVPFLGVHFTPSADATPVVSIGPTATPAWGRENYRGLQAIERTMAAANLGVLARQYLANRGGFRRYVHEQAFLAFPPLLIRAAQELIPTVRPEHIELSQKVGIRSQLFNRKTERLEDDFLCLPGPSSTHVLNAISPAFTASFALADLILDQALPSLSKA